MKGVLCCFQIIGMYVYVCTSFLSSSSCIVQLVGISVCLCVGLFVWECLSVKCGGV